VWLCRENDWVYRHLHIAASRMVELAGEHAHAGGLKERAVKQAARELLLAQSSDWAFIMHTGTMVDYAIRRTKQHVQNFLRLYDQIKNNSLDESFVGDLEYRNNIFPNINIHHFTDKNSEVYSATG